MTPHWKRICGQACLILLLASTLALIINRVRGNPLEPSKSYSTTFTAEQIDAPRAMAMRQDVRFIDPRSVRLFQKGHIPGAINLHKSDPRTASLGHDNTFIVYCDLFCPLAEETAALLHEAGYEHLYVLGGGMAAWQRAGYRVETGEEEPAP